MAERRQPFRFMLSWLAAPQPAPAAPLPSQVPSRPAGKTPQRPPFHPAAEAPAQAESLSPSTLSQGPSKVQVSSRNASPAKLSSKLQQEKKVLPQSPSPSRGGKKPTRLKATETPPPTPSHPNLPLPTKKPPTITSEISQKPKDIRKQETSKPHSKGSKQGLVTAPSPEKVVELLGGPTKQPAYNEPKIMGSTELKTDISNPKQEPKQQQTKEFDRSSYKEAKQSFKDNNDKTKKEAAIDREVKQSMARTQARPFAGLDKQKQHSEEENFDIKEHFKKIENNGYDNESESHCHEEVTRFPHKHKMEGQKAPFRKEIKENVPKFPHKQVSQRQNHLLDENPCSIVTLTGENNGATMRLSCESLNKERPIHIHRRYKVNPYGSTKMNDGDGNSRGRKFGDTNLQEELAAKSYVNNNAQGMNNSIVLNSTVTERNPGVHVVISHNQAEQTKSPKERKMFDAHNVKVSSTPAQRLAYEPTIRRRCLQSLLLESSDSEPEKPRRHGCRIGYTQKSKDGISNVS